MTNIDFRSDTVTWPTQAMRDAMAKAEVGDDVYQDDLTTKELENYGASLVAKEAALFVPSGTFGNELALFTHCKRGQEVVLPDNCHIIQHECGASSIIAGVQLRTVEEKGGMLLPSDFSMKIRRNDDIHEPKTGLICIENARSNGRVESIEFMEQMYTIAKTHHVPLHLDGARIFNAATHLDVPAVEIAKYSDSVMFCLSKGLCAPIGSLLAGSADFIERARWNRKIMGGGMRQTGMLAAAGLISLREMRLRLSEDHENATFLANELATIPEIQIDVTSVEINMVFFSFVGNTIDTASFTEYCRNNNILINDADSSGTIRLVTHYWIHKEDCEKFISTLKDFLK
ncbi:MAG: threonine aldolase [Treponema sp. CETP13]|nr:MAG: threonine aldolase [Treponema sp. CETP13]